MSIYEDHHGLAESRPEHAVPVELDKPNVAADGDPGNHSRSSVWGDETAVDIEESGRDLTSNCRCGSLRCRPCASRNAWNGRFEKEFMGRGPTETKTYIIDDLVLVRLRGIMTPAEQLLVQAEDTAPGP
jgi:hypothetical protein